MTQPLVSVAMITYNQASYIGRAIDSVLQQKVSFPIELIVGEDCSTDATREIVMNYQARNSRVIRVITSERNVGMFLNLKRVEDACIGRYIAYCDGDDWWHDPFKLQKQLDYLEHNRGCGLVHSDYDRYYPMSGKVIRNFNETMQNKPRDNLDVRSIVRGGRYLFILTCTVVARRQLLKEVVDSDPFLFEPGRFLIGDTQRWAEIAARSGTHYIDESLSTYTVQEESGSKSKDPIKIPRFGKSLNELFLYLSDKHNLPMSDKEYFADQWRQHALQLAFHQMNRGLAEDVRAHKLPWSPKERLLYYGAKGRALNKVLMAALSIKHRLIHHRPE
jgi:glycosyltransferase involved in cell wall biosynthesis